MVIAGVLWFKISLSNTVLFFFVCWLLRKKKKSGITSNCECAMTLRCFPFLRQCGSVYPAESAQGVSSPCSLFQVAWM